VSVKGGGTKLDEVRSLNHVHEREKAEIALFISLEQPTPAMVKECRVGRLLREPNGKKFARVQLLTIDGLRRQYATRRTPRPRPELQKGEGGE